MIFTRTNLRNLLARPELRQLRPFKTNNIRRFTCRIPAPNTLLSPLRTPAVHLRKPAFSRQITPVNPGIPAHQTPEQDCHKTTRVTILYRVLQAIERGNTLNSTRLRTTKIFLAAVLAFTGTTAVFAQTQAINGSIRGYVTDPTGTAVPAARVNILNEGTGYARAAESNDEGLYLFPNLPLGKYTVTIQKEGFSTERHAGVELNAGTEATIDALLKVGSVDTQIEVSGGAPILDTSRMNTGRIISTAEVENLPLTSRNPYNYIIFQPGVSGHPNAELGIPRTINTNGLLDRINYQMDGMVDSQSDRHGLRLFPISNTFVREVQTVSNSYAPEFGGTAGNIFNVISNSGSNAFHGTVYYIGRPVDASARPILLGTAPKPNLTLKDFATNAGGRLVKDKLFWFGSYEKLDRGLPSPITITAANAAALGLSADNTTIAPAIQHATFANVRFDYAISSKHQFFARYNYFRNDYPFNTAVGGLNATDASSDFLDRAHVLGTQLISSFSPTVLNEFRFGFPYRNNRHVAGPTAGPGPQISISGVANFNGTISAGDRFQEKIPNINDNLTVIRGSHTLKAGFGWQQMLDTQTSTVYNQFVFSSIANYNLAKSGANPFAYNTFNAQTGLPGAWYHSVFWDFFVQDNWQISKKLLLLYGVRYDQFDNPSADKNAPFSYSQSFRTPKANFAPRLGLAYSVDAKTVLRINAGMFYEAPATNLWYNSFVNDGTNRPNALFTASLPFNSPLAPPFPKTLTSLPAGFTRVPDITTVTPNFKNDYAINLNLQITRQLSANDALTVGGVHTGTRNLPFLRNLNLINPTGRLADGRPIYSTAVNASTRLDPRFNNITLQDIGAIANYNALIATLQHRFAQGFQASVSYTWSHTISDAPDANSFEQNLFIEDNTSRARDRGNSLANRPQALTGSFIFEPVYKVGNGILNRILNDNQLSFLANVSSGDQQNITANRNLNNDSKVPTRPLFIARNALRGPSVYQFDARYTRTFLSIKERIKPKFFAEINNIFNHPNITSLNAVVPVDSNGLATFPAKFSPLSTVLEGRIIQLGVRVDW
jgi:hypothetical protein